MPWVLEPQTSEHEVGIYEPWRCGTPIPAALRLEDWRGLAEIMDPGQECDPLLAGYAVELETLRQMLPRTFWEALLPEGLRNHCHINQVAKQGVVSVLSIRTMSKLGRNKPGSLFHCGHRRPGSKPLLPM